MSTTTDLTGQKFGRLTVIEKGESLVKKNGSKETRQICKCDCGNPNTVLVLAYNLKNGNTKSCGCLSTENRSKYGKIYGVINGHKNKKYNTYDLSGEYGIGYTRKGEPFYFDLEDYDLIKDYCWFIDKNGYVVNKTDKLISMHRLVMGFPDNDLEVDHIFHNKNDNRKEKLRIVTPSQNHMNKGKLSTNTSGYTGVYYHKPTGKQIAEIRINKKKISLGSYTDIDDAVMARTEAEIEYFKEYRYREEGD